MRKQLECFVASTQKEAVLVVKEVGRNRHTSKCKQFSGRIQKERRQWFPLSTTEGRWASGTSDTVPLHKFMFLCSFFCARVTFSKHKEHIHVSRKLTRSKSRVGGPQ